MAADFTGRRVVNLTIAAVVSVPRAKLVEERRNTGLNYGSLFLVEELAKNGTTMEDIAAKLKTGKSIAEIANEQQLGLETNCGRREKLNGAVDRNLSKYFLRQKDSAAQDLKDAYDVNYDGVKADAEVSKNDISAAQDRFLLWKDQAAKTQGEGRDKKLSAGDERVAYSDHLANGGPALSGTPGPGSSGTSAGPGTTAPVGMGGPH